MNSSFVLLAQLDGLNPLNPTVPGGRTTGLLFKDVMVIIATGLILALFLILWARRYVRKKGRRHYRHHHERAADSPITPAEPLEGDVEEEESEPERRRQKRRRRRDHRSRNPTLAETGGLPPAKPEGPSTPSL